MKKKKLNRQEEKTLAMSLQKDKGDLSAWSEKPVQAKVGKERGGIMFSIRFSHDELTAIRRRAAEENIPISTLIKRSVLELHQPAPTFDWATPSGPMFYVPSTTEIQFGSYSLQPLDFTLDPSILDKVGKTDIAKRFKEFSTSKTSSSDLPERRAA